jgi:predicted nucleic acid-binding protein
MLNLVDSCGWMEYFCDSKMAKHYAAAIEDTESLIVPSICIYEVFKKVLADVGEQEALQAVATMQIGEVLDFDDSLAISAALISRQHKLPMVDSIVMASAKLAGATIWTQDAHFEGLPDVKFFRKHDSTTF